MTAVKFPYVDKLPTVTISLDFEMRWGMHDKIGLNFDVYRKNIENEREIVPELLKLFYERNISATWACVGALGCRDWKEYFARAPKPPNYHNPSLAVDPKYAELDPAGYLHFAPDLLHAINASPRQELGTHTFSHIYLREPGIVANDVSSDLEAVCALWSEMFGHYPTSIVFPRNQYAFLELIRAKSIRVWRGNEKPWYFNRYEERTNLAPARLFRLFDSINPFIQRASPIEGDMTRSSLFIRFNLPKLAWRLQMAKIRTELSHMRPSDIFHIWWHPHNLGHDLKLSMARLVSILDLIAERCQQKTVVSKTMSELVAEAVEAQ